MILMIIATILIPFYTVFYFWFRWEVKHAIHEDEESEPAIPVRLRKSYLVYCESDPERAIAARGSPAQRGDVEYTRQRLESHPGASSAT